MSRKTSFALSADESAIRLDVAGTYDAPSRTGLATVTITPDAALAGTNRLYAALTESELDDPFPNGILVQHDILREFIGADDTDVTFAGAADDPIEIVVPFSLGAGWATEHVKLVVFVQDELSNHVEQAATVRIPDLTWSTPVQTTSWSELKVRF